MSGKYAKTKAKKKKHVGLWIGLILALGLVLALLLMLPSRMSNEAEQAGFPQETQVIRQNAGSEAEALLEGSLNIPLKNGLEILEIGAYTGMYMEDGSDELVTDVLMVKLANKGASAVEYAKITLPVGGKTAEFTVTTLQPGSAVILLEKNRMAYDKTVDYSAAEVTCENLALFQEPLSLQKDKIEIQCLKGAINVTNVSGQDIPGRIAIYYKNKAAGIYYGGITYRIVLEDGLEADEIRQMIASHFSETGSEILFVTIAQ